LVVLGRVDFSKANVSYSAIRERHDDGIAVDDADDACGDGLS
jgi:hypothetical protein